jgi:hypothetical protein
MLQHMNKPVILSDKAYATAEKLAKDMGFDTVEAYFNALMERDVEDDVPGWMWDKIEAGLASGPSLPLTRDVIHQLVDDGIARAKSSK